MRSSIFAAKSRKLNQIEGSVPLASRPVSGVAPPECGNNHRVRAMTAKSEIRSFGKCCFVPNEVLRRSRHFALTGQRVAGRLGAVVGEDHRSADFTLFVPHRSNRRRSLAIMASASEHLYRRRRNQPEPSKCGRYNCNHI
jgi:hypothetical protein